MDDYSKIADHYEVPLPDGSTLYLANRITNRVKANYQSWLAGNARREAFNDKELTPDQLQQVLESITVASASGAFRWGGNAWRASMKQLPGLLKMVSLLAEAGKKTAITEERVAELIGVEGMPQILATAVREVCTATPNFLSPPVIETMAT